MLKSARSLHSVYPYTRVPQGDIFVSFAAFHALLSMLAYFKVTRMHSMIQIQHGTDKIPLRLMFQRIVSLHLKRALAQ